MPDTTVYSLSGLSSAQRIGEITMYHGDIDIFPTNSHALCDGSSGTPDLRGQFIRGWSDASGQEYSGSSARRNNTQTESIQSHTHATPYDLNGSTGSFGSAATNQGISNFFQIDVGATGGPETRPKNYALAYIMRIA